MDEVPRELEKFQYYPCNSSVERKTRVSFLFFITRFNNRKEKKVNFSCIYLNDVQ